MNEKSFSTSSAINNDGNNFPQHPRPNLFQPPISSKQASISSNSSTDAFKLVQLDVATTPNETGKNVMLNNINCDHYDDLILQQQLQRTSKRTSLLSSILNANTPLETTLNRPSDLNKFWSHYHTPQNNVLNLEAISQIQFDEEKFSHLHETYQMAEVLDKFFPPLFSSFLSFDDFVFGSDSPDSERLCLICNCMIKASLTSSHIIHHIRYFSQLTLTTTTMSSQILPETAPCCNLCRFGFIGPKNSRHITSTTHGALLLFQETLPFFENSLRPDLLTVIPQSFLQRHNLSPVIVTDDTDYSLTQPFPPSPSTDPALLRIYYCTVPSPLPMYLAKHFRGTNPNFDLTRAFINYSAVIISQDPSIRILLPIFLGNNSTRTPSLCLVCHAFVSSGSRFIHLSNHFSYLVHIQAPPSHSPFGIPCHTCKTFSLQHDQTSNFHPFLTPKPSTLDYFGLSDEQINQLQSHLDYFFDIKLLLSLFSEFESIIRSIFSSKYYKYTDQQFNILFYPIVQQFFPSITIPEKEQFPNPKKQYQNELLSPSSPTLLPFSCPATISSTTNTTTSTTTGTSMVTRTTNTTPTTTTTTIDLTRPSPPIRTSPLSLSEFISTIPRFDWFDYESNKILKIQPLIQSKKQNPLIKKGQTIQEEEEEDEEDDSDQDDQVYSCPLLQQSHKSYQRDKQSLFSGTQIISDSQNEDLGKFWAELNQNQHGIPFLSLVTNFSIPESNDLPRTLLSTFFISTTSPRAPHLDEFFAVGATSVADSCICLICHMAVSCPERSLHFHRHIEYFSSSLLPTLPIPTSDFPIFTNETLTTSNMNTFQPIGSQTDHFCHPCRLKFPSSASYRIHLNSFQPHHPGFFCHPKLEAAFYSTLRPDLLTLVPQQYLTSCGLKPVIIIHDGYTPPLPTYLHDPESIYIFYLTTPKFLLPSPFRNFRLSTEIAEKLSITIPRLYSLALKQYPYYSSLLPLVTLYISPEEVSTSTASLCLLCHHCVDKTVLRQHFNSHMHYIANSLGCYSQVTSCHECKVIVNSEHSFDTIYHKQYTGPIISDKIQTLRTHCTTFFDPNIFLSYEKIIAYLNPFLISKYFINTSQFHPILSTLLDKPSTDYLPSKFLQRPTLSAAHAKSLKKAIMPLMKKIKTNSGHDSSYIFSNRCRTFTSTLPTFFPNEFGFDLLHPAQIGANTNVHLIDDPEAAQRAHIHDPSQLKKMSGSSRAFKGHMTASLQQSSQAEPRRSVRIQDLPPIRALEDDFNQDEFSILSTFSTFPVTTATTTATATAMTMTMNEDLSPPHSPTKLLHNDFDVVFAPVPTKSKPQSKAQPHPTRHPPISPLPAHHSSDSSLSANPVPAHLSPSYNTPQMLESSIHHDNSNNNNAYDDFDDSNCGKPTLTTTSNSTTPLVSTSSAVPFTSHINSNNQGKNPLKPHISSLSAIRIIFSQSNWSHKHSHWATIFEQLPRQK